MKIKQLIKYYIYRFKWHAARYVNYSSPVHLDIELSTRCNLNCEFCFRQDYKYEQKDMDYKMLITIAEQMNELNVQSVKPNWRGEALINPEWMMLGYVFKNSSMYPKINSLEINTSLAMKLADKEFEYLAQDFDKIDVSIDSMNKKEYEKIRKGANFELTLSNLKRLYNYRQKYNMPAIIINRRTSKLTTESNEQFIYQLSQIGKFKYDGLVAVQCFQIFSPVVSFVTGEFFRFNRVGFFLLSKQWFELAAICSVGRGGFYSGNDTCLFLDNDMCLVTRPGCACFLPLPGIRVYQAEKFIFGIFTPIRNSLFQ